MRKKTLKKAQEKLSILKTDITITPHGQLLEKITTSLKKNVQIILTTPNPEILVMASRTDRYRKIINSSDIAVPDGVGVTWAIKLLHNKDIKRIRGRELFLELLDIANDAGYKIYLLGGSMDVNKSAVKKINNIYPNIKVQGSADIQVDIKSNFEIDSSKNNHIDTLNHVNKFKPHVLVVALGAPKQEIWISENQKKLDAKLLMALGGSLDYFVGKQVVPPNLVSSLGLEWIWRLIFQPRRLKRIFNAVIVFPLLVIREKLLLIVDNKIN